MTTTKLKLPTISGNMNADVVRDMNALAQAIDGKAGTAGGLATLGPDGKVPSEQVNVDTSTLATKQELAAHLAEKASTTKEGHVQLSSATNSGSEEFAATSKAVKAVLDASAKVFTTAVSDANALTQTGIYSTASTFVGSPYAGTHGANQGYLFNQVWFENNTKYIYQRHIPINNAIERFRIKNNDVWGPWTQIVDTGNLASLGIGKTASGNYAGNSTQNRFINVGFTPKLVVMQSVYDVASTNGIYMMTAKNVGMWQNSGSSLSHFGYSSNGNITGIVDNGFNVSSAIGNVNATGNTYYWTAIG